MQSSFHPERSDPPGQPTQSFYINLGLNLAHNVTQILLGAVVVSAMIIPNIVNLSNAYAQHIVLCTIGYFVLMTQAILVYSPFGWAVQLTYEHKRIIHLSLQILGSILVVTGTIVRMSSVNNNLNSTHGVCGFIAMLLTICSLVGGLVHWKLPNKLNAKIMRLVHAGLGAATLLFAFIAIMYAFNYYYRTTVGARNATNAVVVAVFALIGTLFMASFKNVKRVLNK